MNPDHVKDFEFDHKLFFGIFDATRRKLPVLLKMATDLRLRAEDGFYTKETNSIIDSIVF